MEATNTGGEPSVNSGTKKVPRQRSAAYPSYTIESAIAFTTKVDREFTSIAYTPKEDISKGVGLSGGAFLMQLSSCVQYGLLDKEQGEGYKPSDLFKRINRPLPTENVADFIIECLTKPPLYKAIIEQFSGKQLPSMTGLANILDRKFGIVGNASVSAAKIFLRNLEHLGLKSEENALRIDAFGPPLEEKVIPDIKTNDQRPILIPSSDNGLIQTYVPAAMGGKKEIPVFLSGGREAILLLPLDFTDADMQKIVKVLTAYLP